MKFELTKNLFTDPKTDTVELVVQVLKTDKHKLFTAMGKASSEAESGEFTFLRFVFSEPTELTIDLEEPFGHMEKGFDMHVETKDGRTGFVRVEAISILTRSVTQYSLRTAGRYLIKLG